jgi:DNA repair photolyase
MDVIRKFDPWGDPLCTCPKKLGFNPYTGCDHRCVYCYVSSYVPRAFECRKKKNLVARVERDLRRIDKSLVISMSNSSDPYPLMEAKLKLTRACLELLSHEDCRVQIITKSDLVARDTDLLSKMRCVASFTITTLDRNLSRILEPGAPSPEKRLKAMKELSNAGVPTSLRLDPVIPSLNDSEIEQIVETSAAHGASHVTSSTFKLRPDSWRRVERAFPEISAELAPLYFEQGERHHNSRYLPRKIRLQLMKAVREACDRTQTTFASCREGSQELSTGASCDGSHLIPNKKPD